MLEKLDADHDGNISFEEFCNAAAPLYQVSTGSLRRAFDFFDADGSGYIEVNELEAVLTRLGVSSARGGMHKEVRESHAQAPCGVWCSR